MNKYTQFNKAVSTQAVSIVINNIINDIAFTWLQDNWHTKVDGNFKKSVNDALNILLDKIKNGVEADILSRFGKQIRIRAWVQASDLAWGGNERNERVVFFVDATYRESFAGGPEASTVGYIKDSLYVHKNSLEYKNTLDDKDWSKVVLEIINLNLERYPIRTPEEVVESKSKVTELSAKIYVRKKGIYNKPSDTFTTSNTILMMAQVVPGPKP